MKMEQTECSETSVYKIQTPGNCPEENTQYSEHGESLKSRMYYVSYEVNNNWMCRHYIAVKLTNLNHSILKDRFVGGVSYSPPSAIKFATHFVTALFCIENENRIICLPLTRDRLLKTSRSFQIQNKTLSIKCIIF